MYDNFQIQFGREEFCLVTGLKFGVEYLDDYDDEDKPIPFRDGWDDYPWGLYVWPTLYYQLKDANVKRWLPLYATEPTNEDDKKSYSIFGFIWAFKVFRLGRNKYYTRHMRYPRIVAWTSNKKFYRHMLHDFLHGRVPAERLKPDEVEAGSGWWLSSRAYFDGCVTEPERRPRHLNHQNHYEGGPSSFQTQTNNSIFNMGTPTNWQTSMPSQPGSSNWQSQMPAYTPTPNWQPLIPSHPGDARLCDPVVLCPINVGGNHWVTGAVNLPHSFFYVFDSMESERTSSASWEWKSISENIRYEMGRENSIRLGVEMLGIVNSKNLIDRVRSVPVIRFTVLASISLPDTSKQATSLIVLLLIERISIFTVNTFVSLGCSGNITRIMRRTLKIILVFTVCETQVYWNSVLTRFIDDLMALDSIVHFWFLVVGGWSGLPPFQYRLTQSERDDRNVLISVRMKQESFEGS
ncbi:phospholipase-like protein [Tanacetum coccineum]